MEKANAVVLIVLQASIFHKSVEISAFWQRYRSIRIDNFPRRVSMVILFTIKNNLCAGDYAATVCAIKSTQLKQGRTARCVFSTQEQYPSLFGKRFNFFVIHKTTFRTRKRFHNKQYTSKSKDQPLESERTHFNTGFNNGGIAMHRQTIIFFFLTKSQPFNKKQPTGTINQIKQSRQTIYTISQKNTLKQTQQTISSINRKIYHRKQSHNIRNKQLLFLSY